MQMTVCLSASSRCGLSVSGTSMRLAAPILHPCCLNQIFLISKIVVRLPSHCARCQAGTGRTGSCNSNMTTGLAEPTVGHWRSSACPCLAVQASQPEAKGETVALWVGAAVLFGLGIWGFKGGPLAEQYFAGYLVEQSLSVDNLFVFILVFKYFKTPKLAQDKVCAVSLAYTWTDDSHVGQPQCIELWQNPIVKASQP